MGKYTSPNFNKCAVITVDTQNDFSLPGYVAEITGTINALHQMVRILDTSRSHQIPILHVIRLYKEDGSNVDICRREFVEPIISKHFPDLRYSSALIGPGSEVLGYDTEMSADHDWGPRVLLFIQDQEIGMVDEIYQCLKSNTPVEFYGYPVDPQQTVITSVSKFLKGKLGADISKRLQLIDWLTFPSQVLAEIVGGEVFRDDSGQLISVREQLQYYPRDIWLFLMASTWHRNWSRRTSSTSLGIRRR